MPEAYDRMKRAEIDPTLPHYHVRVLLSRHEAGPAFDREFSRLVGIPTGPSYSTDLNHVVSAISKTGWWWHLSHLEAVVTPTTPVEGSGGMLSNSTAYDRNGSPIRYWSINSKNPALSLCEAWLKAMYDLPDAFYVVASQTEYVNSGGRFHG